MDPNEEKEAERRREEEGAVLVRLQVLNKAGVSLEGVMHGRAERGAPCTFRGNMNKRKMFLDLNEPVPERGHVGGLSGLCCSGRYKTHK